MEDWIKQLLAWAQQEENSTEGFAHLNQLISEVTPSTSSQAISLNNSLKPSAKDFIDVNNISKKKNFLGNALENALNTINGWNPDLMNVVGSNLINIFKNSGLQESLGIQAKDNIATNASAGIRNAAENLLTNSGSPLATAIGLGLKTIDATGGFTDGSEFQMKNNATDKLDWGGIGANVGNFAASMIPGLNWVVGPTNSYTQNPDSISGSYAGLQANGAQVNKNAGANILFGRNRANEETANQMAIENTAARTLNLNRDLTQFAGTGTQTTINQIARTGGYGNIRMGKKGAKLNNPYLAFYISLPKELQNLQDFDMKIYWNLNGKPKSFTESGEMFYKEGGKFKAYSTVYDESNDKFTIVNSLEKEKEWYNSNDEEAIAFRNEGWIISDNTYVRNITQKFKDGGQMNVIPEGALHARKNNMSVENITSKGIPVVDNEGNQTAEIERNEIIFTKEVTNKLEDLFKQYKESESNKKKDELCIECGKYLTEQILHNTKDNTGLIKTVE